MRGIVDKECSPSFVRSVIDDGVDPAGWWATMVELDWPALAIAEEHGGLGMTWVELSILLEELGRATDPSPFVATTTQFAPIDHPTPATPRNRHGGSARVAAGSITGALALGADTVTAVATDGGWRLDGSVRHVVDGDRADEIAIVATVDGRAGGVRRRAHDAGPRRRAHARLRPARAHRRPDAHRRRGRRRPASRRRRRRRRHRAGDRRSDARMGDPDGRRVASGSST